MYEYLSQPEQIYGDRMKGLTDSGDGRNSANNQNIYGIRGGDAGGDNFGFDNFGLAQQKITAPSSPVQVRNQPQPAQTKSGGGYSFGRNQYTDELAQKLTAMSNQNLAQTVMPQINQGAQLAGQYGGSRQGIAQGVAAGNAQAGLDASIAGMYSQAYGQDQNFYTAQRGQDQSGMQLGANLYGMGNSGNLGIGAGQYTLGQTYANAPLTAAQNYGNVVNPYAGFGGSSVSSHSGTSTTTDTGNPGVTTGGTTSDMLQGAVGGGLAAYQMYNNAGA